ncbi:MAG TPA: S8 family peptidase [Tissierellales bacterium]|nr:S8 family peptidase [Tissierellales bacterium]
MVHGTHVAGIIAGNGYSSRGRYTGVAPKSNILAIKALDENGSGNTSDIIKAISWIIETKEEYGTNIINLSLGSPANNHCNADPLCRAVSKAIDSGLIVVAAAGNSGPKANTILSPGISPTVITVGAVDDKNTPNIDDDTVADFSSRGPTREGLQKPDLVAPGVNIKSLSNIYSDRYTSLSGTSMATPLISGSIALLMSGNKNLSQKTVKNKLVNSCIELSDSKDKQGAGMLNLEKFFNDKSLDSTFSSSPLISKDITESFLIVLLVIFLLDKK